KRVALPDDLAVEETDCGQLAADLGTQFDAVDRRELAEKGRRAADHRLQRLADRNMWRRWRSWFRLALALPGGLAGKRRQGDQARDADPSEPPGAAPGWWRRSSRPRRRGFSRIVSACRPTRAIDLESS